MPVSRLENLRDWQNAHQHTITTAMAAVSTFSGSPGLDHAYHGQQNDQDEWSLETSPNTGGGQFSNGFDPESLGNRRTEDTEHSGSIEMSKSSRPGRKGDQTYLLPYKQGARPDLSGSRSGSEPDSLIDLYGHPRSIAEKSHESPRRKSETQESLERPSTPSKEDQEESRWIHRDKLAVIERQEMQAAGISPPLPRSSSKSRHRREKSEDQQPIGESELEDGVLQPKTSKKRKVKQMPREEEAELSSPGLNEFDVRTQEEIAAEFTERSTSPVYKQQTPRSSSSRIPLPKSSPMPLPQEQLERTTPLPRKRNASGTWSGGDEDGISYNKLRSRGNSVGSQVLLDDMDSPASPIYNLRPSSSESPTKTRTGSGTKSSHVRKISTSTPSSNQKQMPTSAGRSPSTPLQRPKSRSGLEPRPPTAINRPEGEAPWLKDMYKPDPRLPPDQQILPTHAKRLQEEQRRQKQWEQAKMDSEERRQPKRRDLSVKTQSSPTTGEIDHPQAEFSPLAIHTNNGLQPTTSRDDGIRETKQNPDQASPEWPLARGTVHSISNGDYSSADRTENAGYTPIPRIRPGQPDNADGKASITGLRRPQEQQIALDPFEKERLERANNNGRTNDADTGGKSKEKGCGCCVVM